MFSESFPTDDVMRTARGLTLLEMLIVLALLAALGALVLPALAGRIGAATAAAAAEELGAAAGMARARAVSRGRAVALVAVREGREVRLFAEEVESGALRSADEEETGTEEVALGAAAEFLSELPGECSLGHEAPSEDEGGGAGGGEVIAERAPDGSDSVMQLAVFLPDGSPLRPHPAYLKAPGGKVFRLDLGACTGRATVTVVEIGASDSEGAAEERGAGEEPEPLPAVPAREEEP